MNEKGFGGLPQLEVGPDRAEEGTPFEEELRELAEDPDMEKSLVDALSGLDGEKLAELDRALNRGGIPVGAFRIITEADDVENMKGLLADFSNEPDPKKRKGILDKIIVPLR